MNIINTQNSFTILSGELASQNQVYNELATEFLREFLKQRNVYFEEIIGVYKGTKEKSFAILGNLSKKDKQRFFELFKQETILERNTEGQLYLLNSENEKVLEFQEIAFPESSENLENYSILKNGTICVIY